MSAPEFLLNGEPARATKTNDRNDDAGYRNSGDGGNGGSERFADRNAMDNTTPAAPIDEPVMSTDVKTHPCWVTLFADFEGKETLSHPWIPVDYTNFSTRLIEQITPDSSNKCYWKICDESQTTSHVLVVDVRNNKTLLDVEICTTDERWVRKSMCARCKRYKLMNLMQRPRPVSPVFCIRDCGNCGKPGVAENYAQGERGRQSRTTQPTRGRGRSVARVDAGPLNSYFAIAVKEPPVCSVARSAPPVCSVATNASETVAGSKRKATKAASELAEQPRSKIAKKKA